MTRSLLTGLLLLAACSAPTSQAPAVPAGPDAGEVAFVDMAFVDMDGTRHELGASLGAGREVALVFWQTWCASCLREGPALARAARQLEGRVDFFGVVPGPDDLVDDDEVRRTATELGSPYPQVRDRDLALTRRFQVDGTPTIVVIGSDGNIRHHGHGPPSEWPTE
jgi:thiol-disulfide isomerase/thioredoxin